MAKRFAPGLFIITLYFLAPIAISIFLFGASAETVMTAYAIWFGVMAVLVMPGSTRWREKAGWVIGLGMFFTTPAILVIVLILKEVGGLT